MTKGLTRLPVFLSYAHEDNESENPSERYLDRLLQMLKPLALNDQVCAWSDREIHAGENWKKVIDSQLNSFSKAAVLLISPAYLASDFVRNGELPAILRRHQSGGLAVLPVIIRSSFFNEAMFKYPDPELGPEEMSLSVFQAVNPPDRPLSSLKQSEQDDVFMSVGYSLKRVFEQTRG
jgi:hypothetical protein